MISIALISCGIEEYLVSEAVNSIDDSTNNVESFEYPGAKKMNKNSATLIQDGIRFNRFDFVDIEGMGETYLIRANSNDEIFKFYNYIMVDENVKWYLCSDIGGVNVIPSKSVKLVPGDKIYYVMTEKSNGTVAIYTLNVYKSQSITVEFENSSTITIDEYTTVDLEKEAVPDGQKEGYKFVKWDFDFTKQITSNTVIYAVWEPIE